MDSTGNASRWQDTQNWTNTFRVTLHPGALQRLRRSAGLTLSALSQASTVNRHHLSRLETDPDTVVYIDTARRLVRGLAGPNAPDAALGNLLEELCDFTKEAPGVHA